MSVESKTRKEESFFKNLFPFLQMKLSYHPFSKNFTKKGRTQEKLTMTNAKDPLPFHNGLARA